MGRKTNKLISIIRKSSVKYVPPRRTSPIKRDEAILYLLARDCFVPLYGARNDRVRRIFTIVLTIIFLFQNAAWSAPSISPQSLPAPMSIVTQAGKLVSGFSSKSPLVVLGKDAHCHYRAQKNIEKILDILIWDYKIDWAGLFFYLSKNSSELSKKSRMILSLELSLYLDILKCSSVSLWESMFSIFNHQKTFSLDRFSINLISIRTVCQKTPGNRGVGGFVNFIYFNQKPLRMFTESFMDIFDFFRFHFINVTFTLKKVNKKVLRKVRYLLDLPITDF